jgi:diguanylate cyclase (GGDEF)-like protein
VKLVMACQAIAVERGTVSILEVASAREFDSVRSYIEPLRIRSLLAVPLLDGDGHAGILILQQCDKQRQWRSTDIEVLKTIAEQMILAVNNAKLRSLVRTLAVTEEKSGLLKRSSYLDVLLSEVKRALEQQSTCTVLLMHFGKSSALVREVGEAAVEAMMEEIGQMVASHIRQNDVAVRYELTTVALILADTSDKNSFFVVDKLRRLLAGMRLPGRSAPPSMTAGIAEAIMNKVWDPVDVVTEVINRAEAALDAAKSEGGNKARSLTPQIETTAAGV